jgi:hypothetical protein
LIHEFGHVLGIGHSPVSDAVMFGGAGRSYIKLRDPDLAAIQSLYAPPEEPAPGDVLFLSLDASSESYGKPILHLRSVAPPSTVSIGTGDADGAGLDDLLLWSNRMRDEFGLWLMKFAPDMSLVATAGPYLGMSFSNGRTELGKDPGGGLVLIQSASDGSKTALGFGPSGQPDRPLETLDSVHSWPSVDKDGALIYEFGKANALQNEEYRRVRVESTAPNQWSVSDTHHTDALTIRGHTVLVATLGLWGVPVLVVQFY